MEEIDSTDKTPTHRVGWKHSTDLHGDFSTLSLTSKRVPKQPIFLSSLPAPMVLKKCRCRTLMGTTVGSPVCEALFASPAAVDDDESNIGEKTPTPKRVTEQQNSPTTPPTPMVHKKRRCRMLMGTIAGAVSPVCGPLFA
jgi:hypothetical protein